MNFLTLIFCCGWIFKYVIGRPELPPPSVSSGSTYSYNSPPSAPTGSPSNSYGPPSQPIQQGPIYGPPSQKPTIHKHVYVHVPPPEPEYQPVRKPIQYPAPQKHYKIVFIKAPSIPAPTLPVIPVSPQNEEKTLVYVLVKKPDDQPDLVIPTPVPTQPSKPEVYFIRYKTQKQDGNNGVGPYPNSIAPVGNGDDYGAPPAPPQSPSLEYGAPN